MNYQSWLTSWQNWSVINLHLYRTYSHFGFRVPTQIRFPRHFNVPDQTVCTPFWTGMYEKTITRSNNLERCDDAFGDQVTAIKCSLCKCSTPRALQSNDAFDDSNQSQSIDNTQESGILTIPTLADTPRSIQRCQRIANRFIVRITTNSK